MIKMLYIERYINGEYEQVWDDLLALGAKVREEQVYLDSTLFQDGARKITEKNSSLPRITQIEDEPF